MLRRLAEVRRLARRLLERHGAQPACTPLGATLGLVDADPIQPGEQLRARVEAADRAPGPEERLLGDLLRLVRTCAQPKHDPVEPLGVDAHQLLEGQAIARLGLRDQPTFIDTQRAGVDVQTIELPTAQGRTRRQRVAHDVHGPRGPRMRMRCLTAASPKTVRRALSADV